MSNTADSRGTGIATISSRCDGDNLSSGGNAMSDKPLSGRRIAFLATDGVEQVELTEPWKAVKSAGAVLDLVSIRSDKIQGWKQDKKGKKFSVDKLVSEVSAEDYDGLVIPGGVMNPDTLRTVDEAVDFVRDFFKQGKPIASICHGPWMLVEAGLCEGRTLTSWPSLKTDVRHAGGNWVDEEVVVDNGIVTSRKPDDLPAFCAKAVEEFTEGRHEHHELPELVGATDEGGQKARVDDL
jgi:protease I